MESLKRALNRLESLQHETQTAGNSAASIISEVSHFMRDLPVVIQDLKQVEVDLETKNDHGGNHDH
ncbi:hypothetical protein BCV73_08695 [Paenibacillus sp. SSG-1]|uniref:hypothetical protein n=1 Tax=Paenibacillus sp. SSG-1 TaxID=1443669 RepID=UPI000B7D2EFA|nr:hypothetical protein [Paenibacillus sp. SSG-1]OXL83146.1 hypothetical protein BCV73_08695 [Paenibacillus sp. SSG-1]